MYLEGDNCTIAEVAYRCGFNDPVYFTRIFKNKIGITPSKYRDEKQEKKSSDQNETGKESN
jgi:AraC-like DNA-binding protein